MRTEKTGGRQLASSPVRVQWDPERDLRGGKLPHRSIQVGIGGSVVHRFVDDWTVSIEDYSPLVQRIKNAIAQGDAVAAQRLLPPQHEYVIADPEVAVRLGMAAPKEGSIRDPGGGLSS